MKKLVFIIGTFGILLNCNQSSKSDRNENNEELVQNESISDKKEMLLQLIQENLTRKIDVTEFLDSFTNQHNVIVLDSLSETGNEETREIVYKSDNRQFKLKIFETDSTSNTLFYDNKTIIDFSTHQLLNNDNCQYKTEEFGFNFKNRLYNVKIIKVSGKEFLYSDILFDCVGIGCGCNLNFIYDISSKKAFFINNFRFPFDNYFLSDFNDDDIIDLLVIGKLKNTQLKGLQISQMGYEATWFEYINDEFVIKKGKNKDTPYSFEFRAYSLNDEYPDTDYSLIIND